MPTLPRVREPEGTPVSNDVGQDHHFGQTRLEKRTCNIHLKRPEALAE